MIRTRSQAEAVSVVVTQLRVTEDTATDLVEEARTQPRGLEVVAVVSVLTPGPKGKPRTRTGGASRWLLTWTPDKTQMKLTRLQAEAQPRGRGPRR